MTRLRVRYVGDRMDPVAIRSVFRSETGPVGAFVDAKARLVLAEAQRTVPVRTGTLLASLRIEHGTDGRGPYAAVVCGVRGLTGYLGYVLFGTAPHIIRARRRRALRFLDRSGGVVFARQVRHPGTRANPFLQKALDAAR